MKKTIDGNTACATIAYELSEVATIYPITPSSTMSELVDVFANKNKKNIFGSVLDVVQMQSEAGASAAMHGALSGGALATTFTSSQGLLLMIPNMYKIAGELLPNVIHVAARAVATHALSIFGDHSDVMSVRQTGYAMLCSSSVQESMDLSLVSHIATLKASVPFLHFFDGFRTSHEINTIEDISIEKIKSIYPYEKLNEFKLRALNSTHPHQQGTSQNPDTFFQNREASNAYYNQVPTIVESALQDVYNITGRKYNLFDYYGDKDAEHIIILMGSGATTAKATIDFLNKQGKKYGVIIVRLFRPFSVKHLVDAIPSSVKTISVLDRTKEPGSAGEPLYSDVITALFESQRTTIKVFGGRYGIGNKDFTPTMVKAVFNNATSSVAKNHFTVGIDDDITHTSLELNEPLITCEGRMSSCKFYGFGGDGTVSANRSTIQILSENTDLYGQAYFEYDSKKAGNSTIVHLRYGKEKIEECYLLNNIDFVGCHNQTYLTKYNLTENVKQGAIFLLNTNYTFEQLEKLMPNKLKKDIATKKLKFYTIDAYKLALSQGLNEKINLIMQTAFFKLMNLLDFSIAKQEIKNYAKTNYSKSGNDFLEKNYKVVELTESEIKAVDYPTSWANLPDADNYNIDTKNAINNIYYENFIKPIQQLKGDTLPVSSFNPSGVVPTGTSKFEKRGIANHLPCWVSENCIQCNLCTFVCPHAAIRSYLLDPESVKDKPEGSDTLTAIGEPEKQFKIQLNPYDCTGCGVCVNVCPAKNKALVRTPAHQIMEQEKQNYDYITTKPYQKSKFAPTTIKGLGFVEPYFEFSGACAGCGETPYIKVLTQLFGDRMIMANATGCSSIYGGTSPACPYTTDSDGNGVAWANSLFEDNAEFGMGIKLGEQVKQKRLHAYLSEYVENNNNPITSVIKEYLTTKDAKAQKTLAKPIIEFLTTQNKQRTTPLVTNILLLKDSFVTQSVWIVGGDGWAYDIGYGGLDHVLASKQNVNILVLDTEAYSNTGGQVSKATPLGATAKFASGGKTTRKKDLGLLATMYKDVYVAKVSMGANPNQLIKAFNEAESYDGVSLIVAYSPCIAHGIDMSKSQETMKRATLSGYWNLWRYNPLLKEQGKNPFVLDSLEPTLDFIEFIESENRYKTLLKTNPDLAKELFEQAKKDAQENYKELKKMAE